MRRREGAVGASSRHLRRQSFWPEEPQAEEIAATETSFFPGIAESVLASAIAQYQAIGTWAGGIEIPRDLYEQSLNVFEYTGGIKQRQPYDAVCMLT